MARLGIWDAIDPIMTSLYYFKSYWHILTTPLAVTKNCYGCIYQAMLVVLIFRIFRQSLSKLSMIIMIVILLKTMPFVFYFTPTRPLIDLACRFQICIDFSGVWSNPNVLHDKYFSNLFRDNVMQRNDRMNEMIIRKKKSYKEVTVSQIANNLTVGSNTYLG